MADEPLAKFPGLFLRGGVYWLRVVIPLDLRPAYEGRTKVVRSLKTAEHREASLRAPQVRAEWLQAFELQRRELSPEPVARIGPELGSLLAGRIRAAVLAGDERLRTEGRELLADVARVANAGLERLTIRHTKGLPTPEPGPRGALDGLDASELETLQGLNAAVDADAAVKLAAGRLTSVIPMADRHARELGLRVDWMSPEARPVLQECLKAYRQARKDVVRRDQGEDVPTPEVPTVAKAASPKAAARKLRDVFELWKVAKVRGKDAVRATERALKLFEEQAGDLVLSTITRAQGADFRAWLLTQPTASKTAHDRLTAVKTLLRYAARDLEWLPRQPWEGLDLEHKTEKPRRPWTDDQLRAFFGLPLFTRYELPTDWRAGADAAYWIPLLGLYTGARIIELCQLRVVDVITVRGHRLLRISEDAEDAQVKTEAGLREVPLHPELVRLGFLEYVEAMREAGSDSLWPRLRLLKGKPGKYFSDWFGTTRGLVSPKVPDFHSLRHTARTELIERGAPGEIADRVTGHAAGGSVGNRVYSHPVAAVQQAVERMRYDAVQLARVYRAQDSQARQGEMHREPSGTKSGRPNAANQAKGSM